tara:strand:- start:2151 stop:2585 length:435 start_codon:yes stop_codon:yes gene_type:complete
MLIQFYRKYLKSGVESETSKQLYKKWRKEPKAHLSLKRASIESIIEDENYIISKTDIVLIADNLSIPIVLLYEFKKSIKLTNISQKNNFNFCYFVKIASRTDQLYLAARSKSIYFDYSDLDPEIRNKLNSDLGFNNFSEYLSSP